MEMARLGVLDAEAVIVDLGHQGDSVALAQEEERPAGHLHPQGGPDGAFDVEDEIFPRVGPARRGEIRPACHRLIRNHAFILDLDETLSERLGEAADGAGAKDRSEVIREFVRWYV